MAEQHETVSHVLGRFWRGIKRWAWKCGTLLMERKENGEYAMSLGRVALCVLLVQAMWKWAQATPETPVDLPPGMKETLFFLMAYNFGSKGLATAKTWIEGRKRAKASST